MVSLQKINYKPSKAMMVNITIGCSRPLIAIITPKSVPTSLTIKLFTVIVSPHMKASVQPSAKFILDLLFTCLSSSSDRIVSSTRNNLFLKLFAAENEFKCNLGSFE